jgi:diguanylate cyclase (GGDEF)-like protein
VWLDRIVRSVRHWALWSAPPAAVRYFLAVDLLAIVLGALAIGYRWERPHLVVVPLLICAVASVEGARRVERIRRQSGDLHKDLQSAWTLAAALILPLGVAVVVALVMYGWWRVRAGRCRWFAAAISASMIVLAVLAAGTVWDAMRPLMQGVLPHTVGGPLAVLASAVAYEVVDVVVCGVGIKLLSPGSTRAEAFGNRATAATDAAALTFGGLVTIVAYADPWAILLALPAVVLLQRVLLVDQLAQEARTDTKTGLVTAGWWRERAGQELTHVRARAGRLSVLVADLDHFKRINDVYGHLVGDEALRAVAGAVRAGVRGQDIAGRFGGEEFVVALPDTDLERARLVAERLRARVAALTVSSRHDDPGALPVHGLTVSVGVATFPDHAADLDTLLRAADRALYAAKDAGRNRVTCATHTPIPTTRSEHALEAEAG